MIHTEEKAQHNLLVRTAAYFVLRVFNNKIYDNKKNIKKFFFNIYKKTLKILTPMVSCVANWDFLLLWCHDRKPSLSDRVNSAARRVAVQWPPYEINRQQYIVIGKPRQLAMSCHSERGQISVRRAAFFNIPDWFHGLFDCASAFLAQQFYFFCFSFSVFSFLNRSPFHLFLVPCSYLLFPLLVCFSVN